MSSTEKPKFCNQCGTPVDAEDTLCPFCGSALVQKVYCNVCGAVNKKEHSFCVFCGSPLVQNHSAPKETEEIKKPIEVEEILITEADEESASKKAETTNQRKEIEKLWQCCHCGSMNAEYCLFCVACSKPAKAESGETSSEDILEDNNLGEIHSGQDKENVECPKKKISATKLIVSIGIAALICLFAVFCVEKHGTEEQTWISVVGVHFNTDGPLNGLYEDGESLSYFEKGKPVSGWQKVEKDTYYFDGSGFAVNEWQMIDGKNYYFKNRCLATGWTRIDNQPFCFAEDGSPLVGWQELDGKKYLFEENGVPVSGWQMVDGKRRYFVEGQIVSGWQTIGENKIYIEKNGDLAAGWREIDGDKYYFEDGMALSGWQTIDGKEYYFENDGVRAKGWVTIRGRKVYFVAGELAQGWRTIERKQYWFEDGIPAAGWVQLDNAWYYFEEDGVMVSGHKKIDGAHYVFADDGKMLADQVVMLSGKMYYLGTDGKCYQYAHTTVLADVTALNSGYTNGSWDLTIFQFNSPVYDCVKLSVTERINSTDNITVDELAGEWALYLRLTDGRWIEARTYWFDGTDAIFECEFESPISFDAYCFGKLAGFNKTCSYKSSTSMINVFVLDELD